MMEVDDGTVVIAVVIEVIGVVVGEDVERE